MCTQPITLYFKKYRPINFESLSKNEQTKWNKPKFKPFKDYYSIQVGCGKCLECKLKNASEWADRCTLEAKQWASTMFLTLTYDDKNLPKTKHGEKTLRYKDVQDFFKRLRKNIGGHETWTNPNTGKEEKPLRYFVCGEYGKKGTKRPHYHAIIFNLKIDDLKLYKNNKYKDKLFTSEKITKIWGKGYVVIGTGNYETAAYIARYTQKKAFQEKRDYYYVWQKIKDKNGKVIEEKKIRKKIYEKEPEFVQMSRAHAIGKTWWDINKKDFMSGKRHDFTLKTTKRIKICSLCRYFKKKWEEEDWETYHKNRYENIKKAEIKLKDQLTKLKLPKEWIEEKKIKFMLEQRKEILIGKMKYFTRDNFI